MIKTAKKLIKNFVKKSLKSVDCFEKKGAFENEAEELFFKKKYEDDIYDCTKTDLSKRIEERAEVFQIYLADIMCDGLAFFKKCSRFLKLQCPELADELYGIWLDNNEIHSQEMSFFCKKLEDVDFGSMHNAFEFSHISVRRPYGKKWTAKKAQKVFDIIHNDLDFDGIELQKPNKFKESYYLELEVKTEE